MQSVLLILATNLISTLCIINVTFIVLTNMIEMASHWRLCRKGYNWLSWGNNNLLVCSMYVSCHFEFFTWSWLSISRLIWKVINFSTKLQTRFIMVQQSSRIFSVKSNNTKSLYSDIIFHETECLYTLIRSLFNRQ